MQSIRNVKKLCLLSLAALSLTASAALAQPPIARTKPVVELQQQQHAMMIAKQRAKAHGEQWRHRRVEHMH